MLELRSHQKRTVATVAKLWSHKKRRVLVYAPTGAGKTIIAASMIAAEPGRVLFVAPWRELIEQTRAKLNEFGISCGTIMGESRDTSARVMVASLETLRRLDTLPPADLVVVDEAHRASTELRRALFSSYRSPRHLLLSATPWREKSGGLRDLADVIVPACTYGELFAAGYLVKPTLFAPSAPADEAASLAYAVGEWFRVAPKLPTIWFVPSVEESQATVALLRGRGIAAYHVDGQQADDERRAAVDAARAANGVLVNVGCLIEGFDWPAARCAVLRRCQSLSWWVQASGRIMRSSPGKTSAVILDPGGVVHRFGPPWLDRSLSLDGAPRKIGSWSREHVVLSAAKESPAAVARDLLAQWRGSVTESMVRTIGRATGYGSAWVARELAMIHGKAPLWMQSDVAAELKGDALASAKMKAWF